MAESAYMTAFCRMSRMLDERDECYYFNTNSTQKVPPVCGVVKVLKENVTIKK